MSNIPKGFKLVPVEPTDEMIDAMRVSLNDADGGYVFDTARPELKKAVTAAIAAAPTPPQPLYDEAKERELFEAYASTHYRLQELPLDFDDGEYIEPEVQYSWESWEARAKAVEVGHE